MKKTFYVCDICNEHETYLGQEIWSVKLPKGHSLAKDDSRPIPPLIIEKGHLCFKCGVKIYNFICTLLPNKEEE